MEIIAKQNSRNYVLEKFSKDPVMKLNFRGSSFSLKILQANLSTFKVHYKQLWMVARDVFSKNTYAISYYDVTGKIFLSVWSQFTSDVKLNFENTDTF